MEDMQIIWHLNSPLVLIKATSQVRMPINITHFSNIKLKICKIHIIQLWQGLIFNNIWEWHKISNIKESNPEESFSTTQANSGWMDVALNKINTSTITWQKLELPEAKDLIGKVSNRWMATRWPICPWLLHLVDLQWRSRWSNKWLNNKTTCTTSLKLPILATIVNAKAPKEQSLTSEISMTRMRQEENSQGVKESAGLVS